MKKLMLGALLGVLLVPATPALASDPAPANPAGVEGCVVGPSDTCTYTATRSGGFVGRGTFVVSVRSPNGTVTNHSDQKLCTGVILPGDVVTTTTGADGSAGAGNPIPSQADALPSTGGGSTGKTCYPS